MHLPHYTTPENKSENSKTVNDFVALCSPKELPHICLLVYNTVCTLLKVVIPQDLGIQHKNYERRGKQYIKMEKDNFSFLFKTGNRKSSTNKTDMIPLFSILTLMAQDPRGVEAARG